MNDLTDFLADEREPMGAIWGVTHPLAEALNGDLDEFMQASLASGWMVAGRGMWSRRFQLLRNPAQRRRGLQKSLRIDRFSVDPHLIVQMRAGGAAGGADAADHGAGRDLLAGVTSIAERCA